MNKSRKYILAEGVNDSQCFCCGKNKNRHFERHHFPRSHVAGGELYVPLCGMCHDIVDRYCLEDWQESLLNEVSDKLIRNWRVFELMCGFAAMLKQKEGEANDESYDSPIDAVLNLTEETAWEIMKTCEGNMRLLALKVISMCFNEQVETTVYK
jgi:hypothetical protein